MQCARHSMLHSYIKHFTKKRTFQRVHSQLSWKWLTFYSKMYSSQSLSLVLYSHLALYTLGNILSTLYISILSCSWKIEWEKWKCRVICNFFLIIFNDILMPREQKEWKKMNQFSREIKWIRATAIWSIHHFIRVFGWIFFILSGMSGLILFANMSIVFVSSIFLVCHLDFLFKLTSVRPNAFQLMASLKHMIEYEIRRLWRKKTTGNV